MRNVGLNIFDLRSTKQILSQYEILPLEKSIPSLKIVIMSMYFCFEISYVVRELEEKKIYKRLVAKFKVLMENWGGLKPIRSLIEDVFKLAKKTCNMENLHRYTMRSVKNYCSLAVFLTGAIKAFFISDKKGLQRLAES